MVMPFSFIEEITMIQTIYFFTYRNPIIPNYYSRSKYNKINVIIIIIIIIQWQTFLKWENSCICGWALLGSEEEEGKKHRIYICFKFY